jgi:hypothetical protein
VLPYGFARRTSYRPAGHKYIRIVAESCVHADDIGMLRRVQRQPHCVSIAGRRERRDLVMLQIGDECAEVLADLITGTLYDPSTGMSTSPHCFIVR